jgi:hypothetical protein
MRKIKKNSLNKEIIEKIKATDLVAILFTVLIISDGLVFK